MSLACSLLLEADGDPGHNHVKYVTFKLCGKGIRMAIKRDHQKPDRLAGHLSLKPHLVRVSLKIEPNISTTGCWYAPACTSAGMPLCESVCSGLSSLLIQGMSHTTLVDNASFSKERWGQLDYSQAALVTNPRFHSLYALMVCVLFDNMPGMRKK